MVDPAFFNPAAAGYVRHQLARSAGSSPRPPLGQPARLTKLQREYTLDSTSAD